MPDYADDWTPGNYMRVEIWWWLERKAGRLWQLWGNDRASYWFDPVPAYFYRKRKDAEQEANR